MVGLKNESNNAETDINIIPVLVANKNIHVTGYIF